MDWSLSNPAWGLLAAIISAIGTVAAAVSALASKNTAKKALELQDRQYVFESLKACAERANAYAKGKSGIDWSTNDAADITKCLARAMEIIKQYCHQKRDTQMVGLKQYFMNLLIMELYEEIHNGDAASCAFQRSEPTRILDGLWTDWDEVIAFFDIWGYSIATDEDLAD